MKEPLLNPNHWGIAQDSIVSHAHFLLLLYFSRSVSIGWILLYSSCARLVPDGFVFSLYVVRVVVVCTFEPFAHPCHCGIALVPVDSHIHFCLDCVDSSYTIDANLMDPARQCTPV